MYCFRWYSCFWYYHFVHIYCYCWYSLLFPSTFAAESSSQEKRGVEVKGEEERDVEDDGEDDGGLPPERGVWDNRVEETKQTNLITRSPLLLLLLDSLLFCILYLLFCVLQYLLCNLWFVICSIWVLICLFTFLFFNLSIWTLREHFHKKRKFLSGIARIWKSIEA